MFSFLWFAECIEINISEVNNTENWTLKEFLNDQNFTINFDLLLEAHFEFKLKAIKLRLNLPYNTPECYSLTGLVGVFVLNSLYVTILYKL